MCIIRLELSKELNANELDERACERRIQVALKEDERAFYLRAKKMETYLKEERERKKKKTFQVYEIPPVLDLNCS